MDTNVSPAIAEIAPDGQLTPTEWRRFMIEFCRRRIKPGTGSSKDLDILVRASDADLFRMLGLASEEELAQVRAVVAHYAPNEAEDLKSLVFRGQVEMGKRDKE